MHVGTAKLMFRLWPLSFGHSWLMDVLHPDDVPQRSVVTAVKGHPIALEYDPTTYIGRFMFFRGIYEEQIAGSIFRTLLPGMTFVDVGANIGQHTCIAATRVGPTGCVVAIEPQASTRTRLVGNIARNQLANVRVVPHAVGARFHQAQLFHHSEENDGEASLAPAGAASSQASEEVTVYPLVQILDDLGVAKADVLKIDVEGAEMGVMQGAESLFARARPQTIFVECIDSHLVRFGSSAHELIKWLHDHGYEVKALLKGRWRLQPHGSSISADLMATMSH